MKRQRTDQDYANICNNYLITIRRAVHSYFADRDLYRVEWEGFVQYRPVLGGGGNRRLKLGKPDVVATWMELADHAAQSADHALAAGNLTAFAYHYGHAISCFNHPFAEIGMRSRRGARAAGQLSSKKERDYLLANDFMRARVRDPKLTMKVFAHTKGLRENTCDKAVKRGLDHLARKDGI